MGVAYNSYCYSTPIEAATAFNSDTTLISGSTSTAATGTSSAQTYLLRYASQVSGSDVQVLQYKVQYNYPTYSWIQDTTFPPFNLPYCSTPGPLDKGINPDEITTTADASAVAWLIFAAFAATWAVKSIRRAF